MLLFAPAVEDGFPDDAEPGCHWWRPLALEAPPGPQGWPEVLVGRGSEGAGGLLQLRLALRWPALASPTDRPLPIASARFRLLLQGPAAGEAGPWWPTPLGGAALVDRSLSLTPVEAAIVRRLAERGEDAVEVEVELGADGLAPAWSWLASVPTAALRERLAALLGPQPVDREAVEAAFLGLDLALFDWRPLVPAALPAPRDEALRAVARQAAPLLLSRADEGWTLDGTAAPPRLDVDLRRPGLERRRFGLRWSLSAFLDAQPDRTRHLVDLTVPAPFEAAPLCAVNDLPLAQDGIRELVVEVQTQGPSGLLSHVFRPGEASAVQWRYVRATFQSAALQWRARYTVSTADGPLVGATDFREATPLIELSAASVGLTALRLSAEPAVFEQVASLELRVGARTLVLTAAQPQAWAVGRRPPTTATVTGVLPNGERQPLGEQALSATGLLLGPAALGVGEPVAVSLRVPAELAQRAAYLAVQVEGQGWRSLDPGSAMAVVRPRPNRWQAPRLRYRTRHVPRAADGSTRPIVETAWREASAGEIDVEVPAQA